jgi:hypothetical protein
MECARGVGALVTADGPAPAARAENKGESRVDDYLIRLMQLDPQFAHEVNSDPALAASLVEQEHRLRNQQDPPPARSSPPPPTINEDEIRRVAVPLVAAAAEMVRADLRKEFRGLVRKARLRRWTKRQMADFVQSKASE